MSKIGKQPIEFGEKVKININLPKVQIEGPLGKTELVLPRQIEASLEDQTLIVKRICETDEARALHGTWRSHLNNAVIGVSEGFEKKLELVGLGYRAELKGDDLVLNLGFSHPVNIPISSELKVSVEKSVITIQGISKEKVGLLAAQIRKLRPPEPYKGTGVKFYKEVIRRKAGKAAKAVGGGA